MILQKTSWGKIEWLQTDDSSRSLYFQSYMNIGIVTILPHARQRSHIHYETEQFIYVMQGRGLDLINGKTRTIEKDVFYHIPPNVTHCMMNTGDEEIKHIVVSVYAGRRGALSHDLPEIENHKNFLYEAVSAVREQIISYNSPPVTILDSSGYPVLQSENYPDYCLNHCSILRDPGNCACIRTGPAAKNGNPEKAPATDAPEPAFAAGKAHAPEVSDQERSAESSPSEAAPDPETPAVNGPAASFESGTVICPYGLAVSYTPVRYDKYILGHIFSGHLFLEGDPDLNDIDMYETSMGTLTGVQSWIEDIAESIAVYCSFEAMRQNLNLQKSIILKGKNEQNNLKSRLMTSENTVTSLRIDHHFLFNTLNAIAGLALLGDGNATYQAITDLAKMLRYSSSDNLRTVRLEEEISSLRTYLHMQELRYGSGLTTEINCPPEVLDCIVPYNFLQPIVENAFTHGFTDMMSRKILKVEINKKDDRLLFTITNNGKLIDGMTVDRILTGMRTGSGHGLSLVYTRLRNVCGEDFSIEITSGEPGGTSVTVSLPFLRDSDNDTEM